MNRGAREREARHPINTTTNRKQVQEMKLMSIQRFSKCATEARA
jgi:hypothetical protein